MQRRDREALRPPVRGEKFRSGTTGKGVVSCLNRNARSLGNKLRDFEALCADGHYDIIAVTETWLSEKDEDLFAFACLNQLGHCMPVPRARALISKQIVVEI